MPAHPKPAGWVGTNKPFTYLRTNEGHINCDHDDMQETDTPNDYYANAVTFDQIFGG